MSLAWGTLTEVTVGQLKSIRQRNRNVKFRSKVWMAIHTWESPQRRQAVEPRSK